jgi:hypothetical protein
MPHSRASCRFWRWGRGVERTTFGGGEDDRKPLQPEGSSNEVAERGAGTQAKAFAVGTATSPAKKAAAVMQAVVAKEQRQMEMDFAASSAVKEQAYSADVTRFETTVEGLDALEAAIIHRPDHGRGDH